MDISVVGVDLLKSVLQLSIADGKHHIVGRKRLSREQFHRFLAQTTPVHLVMEACSSSNVRNRSNKPPLYPPHSTTRRQAIYPNPFHHITGVKYVRFIGCRWSFLLPPYSPYFPQHTIYLPPNSEGVCYRRAGLCVAA